MSHKYSVHLVWSDKDHAFLAWVYELAGCVADGATRQEALKNLDTVVEQWIATATELKRPIPEPVDCEAHEKMASEFREQVQKHIAQEVQKAVQSVLSQINCLPMLSGRNDPAEWWKQ